MPPAESAGGAKKVPSQAAWAQFSPVFAGAGQKKEKKVNSRFTFCTAALAAACLFSTGAAWAQSPAAAASAAAGKVGVINIRQAIVTTAEGKLASAELQSQFASRQTEIENMSKQVNDLRQRLSACEGKCSPGGNF